MMNERIVAINRGIDRGTRRDISNSTHDKVQALLPWLVVNTLCGDELTLVQEHLQGCTECQADLAWQHTLHANPLSGNPHVDVERAFAKLQPRLDATRPRSRSWSLIEFLNALWHGNSQWMQWALAAQLSVILGLSFMLASPYGNIAAYKALGMAKNNNGNVVVMFKPDTSEQDLRRTLRAVGARIVDGPTVTDAYLLNVPTEKLSGTLRELRSDRTVVIAESLESGDTR